MLSSVVIFLTCAIGHEGLSMSLKLDWCFNVSSRLEPAWGQKKQGAEFLSLKQNVSVIICLLRYKCRWIIHIVKGHLVPFKRFIINSVLLFGLSSSCPEWWGSVAPGIELFVLVSPLLPASAVVYKLCKLHVHVHSIASSPILRKQLRACGIGLDLSS